MINVDYIQRAQSRVKWLAVLSLLGKHSVSIKGEKYCDQVSDSQVHNKNNAPWEWLVSHGY